MRVKLLTRLENLFEKYVPELHLTEILPRFGTGNRQRDSGLIDTGIEHKGEFSISKNIIKFIRQKSLI